MVNVSDLKKVFAVSAAQGAMPFIAFTTREAAVEVAYRIHGCVDGTTWSYEFITEIPVFGSFEEVEEVGNGEQ